MDVCVAEFHDTQDSAGQNAEGDVLTLQQVNTHSPVITKQTLDDAKLVDAIVAQRDKSAFVVLFERYAPKLNGYLLRLGLEASQAEEIVQDVMLTLWRKAHLYDAAKSSLATWLFRIARNRRIDVLRRNRIDYVEPASSLFDVVDMALGADTIIDMQQKQGRVREVLRLLPPDQAGLIQLSFFENLSHAQIAAQTGLPLGTIKSRIRLAFTKLRLALEAVGILSV